MIKTFYTLTWILAAAAALLLVFTGTFDAAAIATFGLIALGLLYGFALWSVAVNRRGSQPESFEQK